MPGGGDACSPDVGARLRVRGGSVILPGMTGHVVVVGSINVDLVVHADRLPAPGETVLGGRFAVHDGGKGANQAVAAARAGARVTMVGAVGDDEYGTRSLAALQAEGVDVSRVRQLGEPTGVALVAVGRRGENQIVVATGATDGWAWISVTDEGPGIAPADQQRIFNRFYRGTSVLSAHTESNSGLGLAIVRQIVEGHDGVVAVDSDFGRGSTFTLWLPDRSSPDSQRSASPPALTTRARPTPAGRGERPLA